MIYTLVVGIDFGTTFSGVSWAITNKPKEIKVITSWDSKSHSCSDRGKCPTQLEYGNINEETPWGYNIPFDRKALKWFKLLLLDPKNVSKDVAESEDLIQASKDVQTLDKSATEIVAGFLRSLWQHSLKNIYRQRGADQIDNCKIHIVITVPAIWPHYVQAKMRSAAKLAGMLDERTTGNGHRATTLDFVSEPEAAALAVLTELHPRPDIKKGDTIVVCDSGGGTTDLISYTVDKPRNFELREAVAGDGALVGGIFVDHAFKDFITATVGASKWENLDRGDSVRFLKEVWEFCIKEQFTGDDRDFYVDVPDGYTILGTGGKRKRSQAVKIKKSDLLRIFAPVVDKICCLVQAQVDAIEEQRLPAPKFIVLVGGFGACRYLFNRLVEAHPNCTILNPAVRDSWTAVCRGAVWHGLNRLRPGRPLDVTVQTRVSRIALGFVYREQFDPKIHDPKDKIWERYEELWQVDNNIQWFTKPGDVLSDGSLPFHHYYELMPADDVHDITDEICCCSSDELPSRRTDAVEELCTIKWDKSFDVRKLKKLYNSKGEAYYKIDYEIRVAVDGPNFNVVVKHGRRKVAEDSIAINYKEV